MVNVIALSFKQVEIIVILWVLPCHVLLPGLVQLVKLALVLKHVARLGILAQ